MSDIRRGIGILAFAAAVGFCMAACGPPPTPTLMPTATPTVAPTATCTPTQTPTPTATRVPVTITLWEEEAADRDAAVLDPLLSEFMAANPDTVVKRTHYGTEDLRAQLQTAAVTGEGPEVVRCPNDGIALFAAKGIILPVKGMFDQAFLDTFLPGALAGGALKGAMFGIPDNYGNHLMLIYNKALVTAVPEDWDQLIATAKGLTNQAAGIWGLVYNTQDPLWLVPFLGAYGGSALDPVTDYPTLNTPAMVRALQFVADLTNRHKIVPPGCDADTASTLFKEGKAAFLVNGDWSLSGYSDVGLDFGTAAMPPIKETGLYPAPMTSGKCYVVSGQVQKGTAKFGAVKRLVEFMTGERAQEMWLEKFKVLPSNKNVANSPLIQSEPILQGSMAQLSHGVAMPTAPELRCFWEGVRPGLEGVIDGSMTSQEAAAKMRIDADRCVRAAGLGIIDRWGRVAEVTDTGGIRDRGLNAAAWKGVQDAIDKLGATGKYLESQTQADYAKNIQQFVDERLDLILTVGSGLAIETAKAARANPNLKFAIVDYAYPDCWPGAVVGKDCGSDTALPNVLGLTFSTDEAAMLAGYLAAGMTHTGKVGTFGGVNIPVVTIYMKGLEAGVKHYNQQHGTTVQLLGWNTATGEGLFTGNFQSSDDARRIAESLLDQGVDILMPVVGPAFVGAAAACQERGTMMIGTDIDQYISAPEFSSVWLTSVMKMADVAVFEAAKQVVYQYFEGGKNYVGTLANGGVAIAPFHDCDAQVPQALKDELEGLKADMISAKVAVNRVLGPQATQV